MKNLLNKLYEKTINNRKYINLRSNTRELAI